MKCSVCGGESLSSNIVLWDELVNDWQLSSKTGTGIDR